MDVSARRVDEDKADVSTGRTVGYVGLVLGIASLFMWSVILGPIAAVVGYYAYSKGKENDRRLVDRTRHIGNAQLFYLDSFQ